MARWRVYGPYGPEYHRGKQRWRIIAVSPEGKRACSFAPTEERANEVRRGILVEVAGAQTFDMALMRYKEHLLEHGHHWANKVSSASRTIDRLTRWLPQDMPISDFTAKHAQKQYDSRTTTVKKNGELISPNTHRNELAEVKTFFRWLVKQRWIAESPIEAVEGKGRLRRGKPQLHLEEAEAFTEEAIRWYQSGERGWEAALGNLLALWLGLSSIELRTLRVRDVEEAEAGAVVWVAEEEESRKTRSRQRKVLVDDEELTSMLLHQREGKPSDGWLFPAGTDAGYRSATWLRKAARRIADRAGVRYSPPHGLRGSGGSLEAEAGISIARVSRRLGHADTKVTKESYVRREALEKAEVAGRMRRLRASRRKQAGERTR
jgi:integrase